MALEKAGVQLVADNAAAFFGDMNKASVAVNQFSGDVTTAAGKTSTAGEIMTGGLRQIGVLAVDMFAKAGQAAVGFFSDSLSVAGDFESGMANFKIAVGDSLDGAGLSLEDFKQDFISIGKELPVSTSEVQEAAIELVKGGIDPMALHLGGLKESIQFATAADMDLAAAAELSAKQMGIWVDAAADGEEQAAFLAKSHDILVKAAGASTVGVDDLAKAMNVAGGQAKALNLDYADFATGMAEIAPAFNSTEEAGTSFKNLLARLQPTTKAQTGAMQALGLYTEETGSAFFDAKGNFVGVREASELLQEATKHLTAEQRASLLQTIFGNDAMGAAVRLAETGAEGYDAMAAKMDKASGVAATAAERQKTWGTAVKNAQGSIEALQITIGSALLPVLTTLFNDYLTPGINVLTDLSGALTGDADAFGRLSPLLQDVVTWVGTLMSGTGGLSDLWNTTLLPAARSVGDYFSTTIMPILSDLGTALFPLLNAAVDVAAGFWSDVLWPALQTV